MKSTASILLALALLVPSLSFAQGAPVPAGDALLQALLQEMRLLRTAIQSNGAAQLRAQVLMQREERLQRSVDELQREVDQWKMNEESMAMEDGFEMHLEQLREQLQIEVDPQRRKEIERELAMADKRQEMSRRHREQMRARQQQKELALREQMQRLEEANEEIRELLEELDR